MLATSLQRAGLLRTDLLLRDLPQRDSHSEGSLPAGLHATASTQTRLPSKVLRLTDLRPTSQSRPDSPARDSPPTDLPNEGLPQTGLPRTGLHQSGPTQTTQPPPMSLQKVLRILGSHLVQCRVLTLPHLESRARMQVPRLGSMQLLNTVLRSAQQILKCIHLWIETAVCPRILQSEPDVLQRCTPALVLNANLIDVHKGKSQKVTER